MNSADVVDLEFGLIHQNISIKTTVFLERLKYRESPSTEINTRYENPTRYPYALSM